MPSPDPDILAHLNAILKNTLTGINQFFLHARMLKHAGEVQLADYEYKASIDAMKHADMLVEHILTLGGLPSMQELGRFRIGEETGEMLRGDLTLRKAVLAQLKSAVVFCQEKQAAATAALLSRILETQQEHVDYLCRQLNTETRKDAA